MIESFSSIRRNKRRGVGGAQTRSSDTNKKAVTYCTVRFYDDKSNASLPPTRVFNGIEPAESVMLRCGGFSARMTGSVNGFYRTRPENKRPKRKWKNKKKKIINEKHTCTRASAHTNIFIRS